MNKLLATLTLGLLFTTSLHAADNPGPLTIELTEPGARIIVPGMAGIEMKEHPMRESEPMFLLRGETEETMVSIMTPPLESEITPIACASAVANSLLALGHVKRNEIFLGRSNDQTFLIIYGVPMEQAVMLNTHIVSSVDSTQCIEAHVSHISTDQGDIEPWFTGFGDSNIETY